MKDALSSINACASPASDLAYVAPVFNGEGSDEEGDALPAPNPTAADIQREMQAEAKHSMLYYRDLAAEALVSAVGKLWT